MLRNLFTFSTLALHCVKSQEISPPVNELGRPMIPGSQGPNQNGCVTDGGYSWCVGTQKCIRPWEEECPQVINYPPVQVPLREVGVGETCGGFMYPPQTCEDGLECVNTMGPLIADAPGSCQTLCQPNGGGRGDDGQCIRSAIPWNCAVWYDGCNSCSVSDGVLGGCTLMMCFTNNAPYCSSFYAGELIVGDLCYRFCEDGSKTQYDRRKDCPINTICMVENNDMISYDTCSNVMKCLPSIVGH